MLRLCFTADIPPNTDKFIVECGNIVLQKHKWAFLPDQPGLIVRHLIEVSDPGTQRVSMGFRLKDLRCIVCKHQL